MLERFKVPDNIAVRVAADDMRATIVSLLSHHGMITDDARQAADVLIYADLRGIDSHGVSNMTRAYVEGLQTGRINARPQARVSSETGSAILIDGDGGLGLVVGPPAMDLAIERARRNGVGVAIVTNAGHYGAAAYYAARALPDDMVGVSMTTGGVLVTPTAGSEPLLGLNPIAIAAPSGREVPFIFDASMSSLAANKIGLLRRVGGSVLPGWVALADGSPVMDEGPIPDGFMMLPLGGTREIGSHKGFGLIMLVEVLTSLLGGAGGGPFRRASAAHFFMALNVNSFSDVKQFKADMDQYLRRLLECHPSPGETRVIYPGFEEAETEVDRSRRGIPYHPEVINWLQSACESVGAQHRIGGVHS